MNKLFGLIDGIYKIRLFSFFPSSVLSIKLKRGFYRLLTHRRGAYRKLLRSLL